MATLEQLSAALVKADAAGNAEDAKAFADAIRQMQSALAAKAGFSTSDLFSAFKSGAVGSTKALTDVAGADNIASQALEAKAQDIQKQYTPERQAEMQVQSARMKEAEASGSKLEEIKAGTKSIVEAPLQTIAQGLGSFVPYVPAMIIGPAAAALGLGARTLAAVTSIANAAPRVMGTAQGIGAVKGSIYDTVYEKERESGLSEEQAKAKAVAAQDYIGKNIDQLALGGVLGYVAGSSGVEKLLTPKGAAGSSASMGKRVLRAGVEESLTEAPQGGQERMASNLALQREGYDVPTFQGVAGQAVQEGLTGALSAGPIAALRGPAPEAAAPEPIQPTEPAPPVAPVAPKLPDLPTLPKASEFNKLPLLGAPSETPLLGKPTKPVEPETETLLLDKPTETIAPKSPDTGTATPPTDVELIKEPAVIEKKPDDTLAGQPTYTEGTVAELPVQSLKLSQDIPQFKEGADQKGVTQEARLEGKFDRRLASPIQVWQRANGDMEVISGRHRLDLAQRSGEITIPAQIHKESDGFTADMARMLDIELNVKDGRGKVKDYVNFFKEFGLTKDQAKADGLLNTAIGRQAYTIADAGSSSLIAAHSNKDISDEAAVSIAINAPKDEALQNLGMSQIVGGKSINHAVNFMRSAMAAGFKGKEGDGDLFGFDDSFAKEAEAVTKEATKQQREARQQLSAIKGAAKSPEKARLGGVDVKNIEATQAKIAELEKTVNDLENFHTNPALYKKLRQDAGLEEGLIAPTPESLAADENLDQEAMFFLRGKSDKQITAFEQSLRALLNKFGLKDVGLKLSEGMRDEGSYAAKLIQIAADSANPIRTLRHEAVHALRELGFFTDAQWKSLSKMAKDKWIDQYLKQRNIDGKPLKAGEESRYDAYMREYKGDMEKITEEAVADAFADFDANKPPVGMIQAILQRLRNLFQSIKSALTKMESTEQIFGKVEKGALKPEGEQVKGEAKSLRDTATGFSRPIFRSALRDGIDGINAKALTGGMWKDGIKGLLNKGAIKADEVEWSGVNEYLSLIEGKVTKEQVLDYLDDNGVQVTETVLGGESARYDKYLSALVRKYGPGDYLDNYADEQRITKEERRELRRLEANSEDKTKYSQLILPGGENYREVLLTLPTEPKELTATRDRANAARVSFPEDTSASVPESVFDEYTAANAAFVQARKKFPPKPTYKSSHWNQPNVLAHIRINDRVDADGNKVLFVEEIQSDWGQSGKKQGFNDMTPALQAEYDKLVERFRLDRTDTENVRVRELEAMGANAPEQRIPSAPFVTKTDAWVALSIKRIIKMAVDGGYDKVAFVNGEQSADRYDLSKQVDFISMQKHGDVYSISAFKDDKELVNHDVKNESEAADVVGKEVAAKLFKAFADPRNGGTAEVSGDGLKVGGEGMKAFYDKIVPNIAKDVLRKLGGQMGTVEIVGEMSAEDKKAINAAYSTGSRVDIERVKGLKPATTQQPGFDITPALREKAARGLPLFSLRSQATKATAAANEAFQKRKPINREALKDVNPDYVNALGKVFNPQSETFIDKVAGMKDGFWRRAAQGIADQYRTIKDYSEESYMLARMSKTIDGALEGLLFHGHVKDDGGALNIDTSKKGLLDVMKPVGQETDRYMMWIALNREARLPQEKRSPTLADLLADRNTLAEGQLNGKSRIEVYQQVQKDMNAINKSVLDIALQKGLINSSVKDIAALRERTDLSPKEISDRIVELEKNPGAYERFSRDIFYVPFYRQMESGDLQGASTASGLTSQEFSKELEGKNDKPFGDLMENTLRNWSHILSASMKNAASNSTLDAAMNMSAAIPNLKPQYVWEDGKVVSAKTGEIVGDGSLQFGQTKSGKGMVKTMVNGSPMYFEVLDPMLLDSISAIGYTGPKSKFLDVARDFKNILQYGVTLAPGFKVRNLIRDSISAMAVSGLKMNPVANVIEGLSISNKKNPTHISALAGGAIFNFGSTYEGDQATLIKRLLKQGVSSDTILDTPDKIKAGLRAAYEAYQDLGNKSEAANRLALYKQMREKGMSHLEAAFHARDLLDFSMQGSWPAFRLLTQVVPFMNARVQGLYKLGRDGIVPTARVIYNTATGKEIEGSDRQKAQAFSIVSSAVALASLALYFAFKDDEEFQKRDEWDRDNFWWFKLPGMEYAFRIPKPFEIGAFGTLVERVAEQIFDAGAEGKQIEDSMKRMISDTFSLNPMPQIIKPLVDLYANKDSFSGAPIESSGMERLSKQERITDNTSPIAILLGGISNVALPESTALSPVQVDYAIKAYFGWLGASAAFMSHYATLPFKDGAKLDNNWSDTMSMGFIKDLPATQSKYVTSFYEHSKEINQAYADMRHFAEIGDSKKVEKIISEKGDLIALEKFYDKTSKDMAKIRVAIRIISNDKELPGDQKREEIDRLKILLGLVSQQAEGVRKEVQRNKT